MINKFVIWFFGYILLVLGGDEPYGTHGTYGTYGAMWVSGGS